MIDAVEALKALSIACSDVAWDRGERACDEGATPDRQKEALSQALHFNGWAKVFIRAAQAIEARRAETTKIGSVEDESAVPEGNVP
jgi:hypothetical protein